MSWLLEPAEGDDSCELHGVAPVGRAGIFASAASHRAPHGRLSGPMGNLGAGEDMNRRRAGAAGCCPQHRFTHSVAVCALFWWSLGSG